MSDRQYAVRHRKGDYTLKSGEITPIVTRPDGVQIDLIEQQNLIKERDLQIKNALQRKIESLETEVQSTKEDAELKILDAQKKGFEDGFQKGFENGCDKSKEIFQPIAEEMMELSSQIESGMLHIWDECKLKSFDIIMEICRRVIGLASEEYRPLALELTKNIFHELRDQTHVTIAVNPRDGQMLREAIPELLSFGEGVKTVEIVERPGISKGGVILESDIAQFDARVEEQLSVVEATLLPRWEYSPDTKQQIVPNNSEQDSPPKPDPDLSS